MIQLDTHVAVWLFIGKMGKVSSAARRLLASEPAELSPMVLFEYEVLMERGRVSEPAEALVDGLADEIGLTMSTASFSAVVARARTLTWTRDPFDRLIVANAMADGARLLTADAMILNNFADAVW